MNRLVPCLLAVAIALTFAPGCQEGPLDAQEVVRQYVGAPGSKAYWAKREPLFSQPFRDFVATLESDPTYLRTRAFARSETGQLRDE